MLDTLLARLDRLRVRAEAVTAAVDAATALVPGAAAGVDASGAVTARLGPAGIPTALRVAPDWAGRLRPEEFGTAVAQACRAAAVERTAEWGRRLERTGWQARADAQLAHPRPAPPRPAGDALPVAPRAVEEIGRDMADALRDAPLPRAPTAAVQAQAGRLTLILTPGGEVACMADPRWVAGQTGAMLTDALGGALADATRRLAATHGASGTPALDRLLAEAMAALAAPAGGP